MFEYIGLAGLGAIFYAARSWLNTAWSYISSIMVVQVTLTDTVLRRALEEYMFERMKPSPLGPRTYEAALVSTGSYGDVSPLIVAESLGGDTRLFWHGWTPIWIRGSTVHAGVANQQARPDQMNLTFFRYSMRIETLLRDAVAMRYGTVRKKRVRHQIIRRMGHGKYAGRQSGGLDCASPCAYSSPDRGWSIFDYASRSIDPAYATPKTPVASLSDMWLCDGAKQVLEDVDYWLKSREWFLKRGIRWRRNYLLWGSPGTGKSTLIRFLAQKHDLPLYVIEINTMCDRELFEVHESLRMEAPCIVLYEDVDNSFHKRDKADPELECSFAAWQNVLDGVKSADGIITFVTTNKPECLDDSVALCHTDHDGKPSTVECTRPGRIDIAVRMEPLSSEGRLQLASRYLPMLAEHERNEFANKSAAGSAAMFQDACIQRAVRWKFESDAHDRDANETNQNSVGII